jgi:hypothetical protein
LPVLEATRVDQHQHQPHQKEEEQEAHSATGPSTVLQCNGGYNEAREARAQIDRQQQEHHAQRVALLQVSVSLSLSLVLPFILPSFSLPLPS